MADLPDTLQRAGDGTRTRDNRLGKPMLYQLSYTRMAFAEPHLTTRFGFLKFCLVSTMRVAAGGQPDF